MRHNQNRRSRGRTSNNNNSNRKGPNPLTRSFESNGPDVKVRGTAMHVAEKYMTLARDAQSSGDIVAAENYLQHAEHYNRIVMTAQAQFQQERQAQFREGPEEGGYDDDRQMNGRGPRDRFESNGDANRDEDGEERLEGSGNDEERIFQPRDDRGFQPRQPRGEERDQPRQSQRDDRDQPRGPRPDRFEPRDRPQYNEGGDRPERFQRSDEPRAEAHQPVETGAPVADEPAAQPRRRGRPPRVEHGAEAKEAEAPDVTQDGAAALAAFPD